MNNLSIPVADQNLPAWLHTCENPAAPCLVVCHGFSGSPAGGSSLELAAALSAEGIQTLRFSFSPHRCLTRQVAEIAAVMQYCRDQLRGPLALMGRSMGAAASLSYTASHPGLAGLCLMACPADLAATFRNMLGPDYSRLEEGEPVTILYQDQPILLTPEFIADFQRHDLRAAAAGLQATSLLVIHGMNDETVPVSHGQQLFDTASCPKQLLLLPNVPHSFTGQADRFVPQVARWLRQQVFADRAENFSAGRC